MHTAIMIVGCVASLLVAAGIASCGCGYLIENLEQRRRSREREVSRAACQELGLKIVALCHWFAEDDSAWIALKALGEEVRDTGTFDVSCVRERWRDRLRAAGGGPKAVVSNQLSVISK